MSPEKNKFHGTAFRAAVHGTAEGWVTAVYHPLDIFDFNGTRMHGVHYFLIMVYENVLNDV